MPAPSVENTVRFSKTCEAKPRRARAKAVANPPIPPPAMSKTLSNLLIGAAQHHERRFPTHRAALDPSPLPTATSLECSGRATGGLVYNSTSRNALFRPELCIINVKRRAVGTDDLVVCAHIEIDVRMIVRVPRTHAVKFLYADGDSLNTLIVSEMWNDIASHVSRCSRNFCVQYTIAARRSRW